MSWANKGVPGVAWGTWEDERQETTFSRAAGAAVV